MISVCIPTYNGAQYIGAQLESILSSSLVNEVIVSDDGSEDHTVDVVKSFNDARIKVVKGPRQGLIRNYEYLFSLAAGDYIFLADQDDVWMPDKVDVMLEYLQQVDLAVCDCTVVDGRLNPIYPSFFRLRHSGPGVLRNIWRNSYLGCCMAFRRNLLQQALPFPGGIPMHDWWLGLIAETTGRVVFIDRPLVMYRRHGSNASPTAERSNASWITRLRWRGGLVFALVFRKLGWR